MSLSAGQRLGVYEIIAPLGAGGMGEVFRARDTRLGREVALKVLPEALAHDRDRVARFEREARAASALNHPNIITIHDVGSDGTTTFLAMELVVGKTLRELETAGPLPVRRILALSTQIAEGLAKAHEAGIVHRDLKPDNVMVSKDGFVKILDFGLAKLAESGPGEVSEAATLAHPETNPGTVMGTVAYMSPEQAAGEPLDFRSDQFSLGSMLYEMTTGQTAFQRKTAAETMAAVIRDEPKPLTSLRPEVPVPMRWAVERCLAKDRDERYASTRDLARDLARMRDHLSETSSEVAILAPAPGGHRRWMKGPLAGVGLLAAGLLAGWALTRALTPASPTAPSFRRLTFRQTELGNARFAPDGQTIVYGARPGGFPSLTLLFRTRVGSPESEKFSFSGDILAISPQDELLILQHLINPDAADGMMSRVPMSSGTPREVLEGVSYAGADFSPDGKELAIARRLDGKDVLEFPAGKVLVADEASTPRVSHDGKRVAFWAGHFGSFAVSVIDRSGTKKVLSEGWRRYSGVPCWSADDREIWFTAPLPGQQEALWAVDMSGRRRLVTRVPGALELDDLSADGRVLIANHTITQTVRLGSKGQPSERELSWLDASFLADLSDDGRTLLLNEQGEGAGESPVVYLRSVDGSPAVKLGHGLGRTMSPDGKWVLIDERSNPGRRPRFSVLPTGPGEVRQLDPGKFTDFGFAAWLPDSAGIVFSATLSDGSSHLYVQPLRAGSPRPIGPEGTRLSPGRAVSPDGKFAIGVRAGQSLLIPIEGEGEGRVIAGLSPGDRVAQWTSDSQGLYFYRFEAGDISVFLLDLKTGHSRLWKQISTTDGGFNGFLRITPDGNTWAYSGRHVQSDLYLVDGLR